MNKVFKFFISSTFTDLKDIRNEAILGVLKAGQMPVMMEGFSADTTQQDKIKESIGDADAYILILGSKYGTLMPDSKISYTEWEYGLACQKHMPIYVLKLSENLIDFRMKNGLLRVADLEVTKSEYKQFLDKVTENRLVETLDSVESARPKTQAAVLSIIDHYRDQMRGLVPATIADELASAQNDIKKISKKNSELQADVQRVLGGGSEPLTKLPENSELNMYLKEKFKAKSTDSIIEDAIDYIKSFADAKAKQLNQIESLGHRQLARVGYDVNQKDEVLLRIDKDYIGYLADYKKATIEIKIFINSPWSYPTVDTFSVKEGKLVGANKGDQLTVAYLNKTLDMYYEMVK
ncbi:conserved hypothetical protein [Oenococcus oeni]|uniref:DUF4062 domain-containing protein n=1 Tax=Oenococcus oeni TaxID=1247 RepID=UPI0010B77EAD|nr:DUF4062 domain-containing protein [Oenococcus oeni]SYW12266.1 conserved hypothetical protein [Oenococcus oeni]